MVSKYDTNLFNNIADTHKITEQWMIGRFDVYNPNNSTQILNHTLGILSYKHHAYLQCGPVFKTYDILS